jgi:hypothetical protein
MGGTGVLPFCGDDRKMQLIVSRVPSDVVMSPHEWGFTIFCYFASRQSPSWKYLVDPDGNIMTAGTEPLGLAPKIGAKSGEVCAPRERKVPCGTLIKMYDYKAPSSNICGELFKKLEEYLVRPMIPLRIIECRPEYKANVMGVTVWDRFSAWAARGKLEEGFEEGASIQIKLSTEETIPAELRVFKADANSDEDAEHPQTGLRALINGQSHAKRDTQFFKTSSWLIRDWASRNWADSLCANATARIGAGLKREKAPSAAVPKGMWPYGGTNRPQRPNLASKRCQHARLRQRGFAHTRIVEQHR